MIWSGRLVQGKGQQLREVGGTAGRRDQQRHVRVR